MKRGKLLGILCAITLVLVIIAAGCTSPTTPTTTPTPTPTPTPTTTPPAKVSNLTFADIHPPENAMNKYIYRGWFDEIEKQSGGRLKITILPASQAAAPPDHFDAARTGIVDMSNQMVTMVPGRFPVTEVVTLPGLFGWPSSTPTNLTANELIAKYPEISAEYAGTKLFNFHATGAHQIYMMKKPINSMADFKGTVIQAFGPYEAMAIKAMGATAESMVITEVYDALAKGVLDGLATSTEGHVVWSWWNITKYGFGSNLGTDIFADTINQKVWDSLPADIQQLFMGDSIKRFNNLLAYQFDKDELLFREAINKAQVARGGANLVLLPESDKAAWTAAMKAVWEEWVKQVSPKITEAKARALLADVQATGAKYAYATYTPTIADAMEKQFAAWGYKFGTFGK